MGKKVCLLQLKVFLNAGVKEERKKKRNKNKQEHFGKKKKPEIFLKTKQHWLQSCERI